MSGAVPFVEVWRGEFLESRHLGHAVVCDAGGEVVAAWGDPDKVILPRSSIKMIQALPLVESGAADAAGLDGPRLALACASHVAAAIHTRAVRAWLDELGLADEALACGPQEPRDRAARDELIRAGAPVCRIHNNCSGKHCGMLTLTRHLGAGPDYVAPDHPVQRAVREAFEEVTGAPSPGFAIDGCSAPNFGGSLRGIARAMAFFADAHNRSGRRADAARRLREAMAGHPQMVSGEGEACTQLMRLVGGGAAIKGGAEGVYTAILPQRGLGVALKIEDGAKRAQEVAVAAILARLGVLDAASPAAATWLTPRMTNFAGLDVGVMRPAEPLAV